MNALLTLILLATSALAATNSHSLMARNFAEGSCPAGRKPCGPGCIPDDWTCCPGALGGCAPSEYCSSPTFCCPLGETCTGEGGVSTILDSTVTQTRTRTNVVTHTAVSSSSSSSSEGEALSLPTASSATSRPVIPTGGGGVSSSVVVSPTPSAAGTATVAGPGGMFTGGAGANMIPVGFGAVAGVVGAVFL